MNIYNTYARLSFLSLLICFICINGSAQAPSDEYLQKVDALFEEVNKPDTPGASVVVVKDGKVVLSRNYGMANLEHGIPITSSTVFDIASLSKQFCGFAIASLIDQGKISYKDDVRQYIPELPDFGKTITIGHLLHHTSGIRDWTSSLSLAGWSFNDVISFEQILSMAYHQQGLNFDPGSEYTYSNTGYNLLAEIVQRVSGQSFRAWTHENIFQPLGMKQSHFQDDHTSFIPNRAYGYYKGSDDNYHISTNNLTALGSSSLFTTTDDLAKWVMNFDQPKAGSKQIIDLMMKRGVLNNGEEINYAFGINVNDYKGLKRVSHGGSWASFRTYLLHFPDERFSVAVLMNSPNLNSFRTAHDIADIYLADKLEDIPTQEKEDNSPLETVDVPSKTLNEYLGTYKLGPAWYVTISRDGETLITTATGEDSFPMRPISTTTFVVDAYGGSTISFVQNEKGTITHFEYRGMECPKLADTSSPSLNDFPGEYISEELNTSYLITIEDDQLIAKHRSNGNISLSPLFQNEFLGDVWYMRSVEFQRNEAGEVTGFAVTQHRSRNQLFKKK